MAPRLGFHVSDGGGKDNTTGSYSGASSSLATSKVNEDMLYSEISKASYADKQGDMPGVQPFHAVFDREVVRITDFINYEQHNLEFSGKSLLTSAEAAGQVKTSSKEAGLDLVHSLSQKMDDLVQNCLELQTFLTENQAILQAVAEKADRDIKTNCASLLRRRFDQTCLNSSLTCIASDIYAAIRTAERKLSSDGAGQDAGLWQAPSSFQRATTKYWFRDDRMTKLLLACAAEAPLLVYGKKGALTPRETRNSRESEGDKLWNTLATPITSVYFDSSGMSLYKKRLARFEGAQLLRARWYGNTMPKGDGIIFLELKTHHEKWVANKSVKERAAVREGDMEAFLRPTSWTVEDAKAMIVRATPTLEAVELTKSASLLFRMHRLVVKHKLQACVRSVYMRAAFQSPKSNDLRLTLDRNVTLIDETGRLPGNSSWCLSDEALQQASKAKQVPFNVFEIKLAGEDGMPPGLQALITEGSIEEAPKFSKFLTGAAAFNRVSTLPYWANHPSFAPMYGLENNRIQKPNDSSQQDQYDSSADPCDMCYVLMSPFASTDSSNENGGTASKQPSLIKTWKGAIGAKDVKIAVKQPVRVEPKSYFANERTFIQWISAGLLLLTVATIMMGNGQFFRTAALVSFFALVLVTYATVVYFRRVKLLSSGKGYGYIDHVGPVILAAGVGMGIFIVFVDVLRASEIFEFGGRRMEESTMTMSGGSRRLETMTNYPAVYEEAGKCFQSSLSGFNMLKYQPKDAIIDEHTNSLLVASPEEIVSHPMEGGKPSHLLKLRNVELSGLTAAGDRMFALSGGPLRAELIELGWTEGAARQGSMEVQGRWAIDESVAQADGLTYVPSSSSSEAQGLLYMDINGLIHSYEIPSRDSSSLTQVDTINMKLINQGLVDELDYKVASMHYFEGVTYLLHSNRKVIHAWDLESGEFLAEIPLPHLVNDMLSDQWSGMTLERRVVESTTGDEGSLRGSTGMSNTTSVLLLHLTSDAPAQIWTFVVDECHSRGSMIFPDCAAAAVGPSINY